MSELFVGGGGPSQGDAAALLLRMANRHGLIAGATGTGKTVTLQILAEGFSAAGVPVVLSDVKGDLSGLAAAGAETAPLHEKLIARAEKIGLDDYAYRAMPVVFWDLFGDEGHPVRTTVTEIGPLLLSALLELSEPQEGVLNIAFRVADEEGLGLVDLADLRALLRYLDENRAEISRSWGRVTSASIGAIQRRLLSLETEGGAMLFGEPALDLQDLLAIDAAGRGRVNILAAARLMRAPRLYATFLLWLLSELFETLPEVGDPEQPKLVFFFDEAHLLFDDAPKALVDKVEQVARLIRSKGVGVFFVTQNPGDVPDDVSGQLGNRVQHALRAYTPREAKALRAAAETFRANPAFDTETAIREVGTGEAVVSLLDGKGVPGMADRVLIRPPASRLGPLTIAERRAIIAASPLVGVYDTAVDPVSAHELLAARAEAIARESAAEEDKREFTAARRYTGGRVRQAPATGGRRADTLGETLVKEVIRSATSRSGQKFIRGVLGGLFKGR